MKKKNGDKNNESIIKLVKIFTFILLYQSADIRQFTRGLLNLLLRSEPVVDWSRNPVDRCYIKELWEPAAA